MLDTNALYKITSTDRNNNEFDISAVVISYVREQHICDGIGLLKLTVGYNQDIGITPIATAPWLYHKITLYEGKNGSNQWIKKGEYYIIETSDNYKEGTTMYTCQDISIKAADTFIAETYFIDYISYTGYWIEKFLTDAGIPFAYTDWTDDKTGVPLSNNTSLGPDNVMNLITSLCQMSGWYFYFDADGVCILGKMTFDPDYLNSVTNPAGARDIGFLEVGDEDILSYETNKNADNSRNRVVVWGNARQVSTDPKTGKPGIPEQVYAVSTQSVKELDLDHPTLDSISVGNKSCLIANSNIPNFAEAKKIADKAIKEFAKMDFTTTLAIWGARPIILTEIIILSSSYTHNKGGFITTIGSEGSRNGIITTVTLNQRCPRLFNYFNMGGYVYIGTAGSGVWRKRMAYGGTWTNFSDGLKNLGIKDLDIAGTNLITVAEDYAPYMRNEIAGNNWTKKLPPSMTDSEGNVYTPVNISGIIASGVMMSGIFPSGGLYAQSCTIDEEYMGWASYNSLPPSFSGVIPTIPYSGYTQRSFLVQMNNGNTDWTKMKKFQVYAESKDGLKFDSLTNINIQSDDGGYIIGSYMASGISGNGNQYRDQWMNNEAFTTMFPGTKYGVTVEAKRYCGTVYYQDYKCYGVYQPRYGTNTETRVFIYDVDTDDVTISSALNIGDVTTFNYYDYVYYSKKNKSVYFATQVEYSPGKFHWKIWRYSIVSDTVELWWEIDSDTSMPPTGMFSNSGIEGQEDPFAFIGSYRQVFAFASRIYKSGVEQDPRVQYLHDASYYINGRMILFDVVDRDTYITSGVMNYKYNFFGNCGNLLVTNEFSQVRYDDDNLLNAHPVYKYVNPAYEFWQVDIKISDYYGNEYRPKDYILRNKYKSYRIIDIAAPDVTSAYFNSHVVIFDDDRIVNVHGVQTEMWGYHISYINNTDNRGFCVRKVCAYLDEFHDPNSQIFTYNYGTGSPIPLANFNYLNFYLPRNFHTVNYVNTFGRRFWTTKNKGIGNPGIVDARSLGEVTGALGTQSSLIYSDRLVVDFFDDSVYQLTHDGFSPTDHYYIEKKQTVAQEDSTYWKTQYDSLSTSTSDFIFGHKVGYNMMTWYHYKQVGDYYQIRIKPWGNPYLPNNFAKCLYLILATDKSGKSAILYSGWIPYKADVSQGFPVVAYHTKGEFCDLKFVPGPVADITQPTREYFVYDIEAPKAYLTLPSIGDGTKMTADSREVILPKDAVLASGYIVKENVRHVIHAVPSENALFAIPISPYEGTESSTWARYYTCSGVWKVETTNTQNYPYIFCATSGVPPYFYQKNGMEVGDADTNFRAEIQNIPSAKITVIRADDDI